MLKDLFTSQGAPLAKFSKVGRLVGWPRKMASWADLVARLQPTAGKRGARATLDEGRVVVLLQR